jgi:putative glutamine amidotransferase
MADPPARRARAGCRTVPPVVVIAGISDEPRRASHLPDAYADAVTAAGGLPLMRPPGLRSPAAVTALLLRADALLFPGGDDFDTARLRLGPVHPQARPVPAAQQDADVELARQALRRRVPVLGICYGMQLLGLVCGARLHQHLPDDAPGTVVHRAGDGTGTEHEVEVVPGTRTAAAVGVAGGGRVRVRSAHHQALASVPPGWHVAARDADGLIEAIERPGSGLAIGVQWHPERPPRHDGLFAALVTAARVRAARVTAARVWAARGTAGRRAAKGAPRVGPSS